VRSTGTDVWLFTGCVMDAWLRDTHRNTALVLDHLGITYATPAGGGSCCGALHLHAGLDVKAIANRVMASMPGDAPIVVNSAGCGAALKDYGHLLETSEAQAFSARVRDVHEFLAPHANRLRPVQHLGEVIVHDPCHLRHVQKAHGAVRELLAPVASVIELDDDGLCCGAGGAYSALEPELATQMRDRKLAAIGRAGGGVVASANPGCAMHLAAAGAAVRHPIDLLAQAIGDPS
jgi:glycolate oxidase iron-sulfur subunit